MRKIVVAVLLYIPFLAKSQTKFGIRAGVNLASIKFYSFDPQKRLLPRLNIGTIIEIPFDENWLLLTGPYYAGKGVIHTRSFMTGRIDSVTIRLNYVELPIHFGYKFSEENENSCLLQVAHMFLMVSTVK